jgi:hypothetical protein
MSTSVSLTEAAALIKACGKDNTFIFQGEPGIGKSAMLKMLGDQLNMPTRYFDCTLLDLGDLQMPKMHDDCVAFVPNKLFMADEPTLYMLDEIGKAHQAVTNGLLPVVYEHRIGEYHLPEGSIVFGTTNLATDGVGDRLQAHAKNRVTFLTVRKPDADEWIEWGIDNDIAPEVMAWVKEYPHCLATYTDAANDDNPYIFNPHKQQSAFVSPRSLAHASSLVQKRHHLNDDTLIAALAGTIGESAARDMQAFLSVADALPSFKSIIADPDKARVPDSPIAAVILALGAVTRIEPDNMTAWMSYLGRLPREVQFLFVTNAMRSRKAGQLIKVRAFTDWARENSWAI